MILAVARHILAFICFEFVNIQGWRCMAQISEQIRPQVFCNTVWWWWSTVRICVGHGNWGGRAHWAGACTEKDIFIIWILTLAHLRSRLDWFETRWCYMACSWSYVYPRLKLLVGRGLEMGRFDRNLIPWCYHQSQRKPDFVWVWNHCCRGLWVLFTHEQLKIKDNRGRLGHDRQRFKFM